MIRWLSNKLRERQLDRALAKRKAVRLVMSERAKKAWRERERPALCPDPDATQRLFERLDGRKQARAA